MRKKLNQLDLFSGIGGFHMGLERAGYKVKSYFSEIDKHAVAVYKHQFKNAEYVGSVTDVRGEQLPKIDIITFGSPCQDFSLAGKRMGMDGQRSSLILEAIRLIDECRPGVFIWENVKGAFSSNSGEDFAAILQAFTNIGGYRLEWQLCNTANYLPQNRERIYLVGYSTKTKRNWRGIFPLTTTSGADNELERSRKAVTKCLTARGQEGHAGMQLIEENQHDFDLVRKGDGRQLNKDIAPTITGGGKSGGNHSDMACIKIKSGTKSGYEEARPGRDSVSLVQDSKTRRGRVGKDTAQTLQAGSQQGIIEPQIGAIRGRKQEGDENYTQRFEINETGESNTLTSDSTMNMVVDHSSTDVIQIGDDLRSNGGTQPYQQDRVYSEKGISPSLHTDSRAHNVEQEIVHGTLTEAIGRAGSSKEYKKSIHDIAKSQPGVRIRRLTPIECERLQGFPDNHTEWGVYDGEVKKVSNTQRYKMCGNAVTVDVVAAIAKRITEIL